MLGWGYTFFMFYSVFINKFCENFRGRVHFNKDDWNSVMGRMSNSQACSCWLNKSAWLSLKATLVGQVVKVAYQYHLADTKFTDSILRYLQIFWQMQNTSLSVPDLTIFSQKL